MGFKPRISTGISRERTQARKAETEGGNHPASVRASIVALLKSYAGRDGGAGANERMGGRRNQTQGGTF